MFCHYKQKISRDAKEQEKRRQYNQLKLAQILKLTDKNIKSVIKPVLIC